MKMKMYVYTHISMYIYNIRVYRVPAKQPIYMFIVQSHLTKRRSVLYFPYGALFSRVKDHKGSLVLPQHLASIVGGSLLLRAHFESLRAAEAKNAATINQ